MAIVQYHPYVNCVQWLGTNVTEIRQFIRVTAVISGASVDGSGNLVLALATNPNSPIVVPVNDWLVSFGSVIEAWTPTDFAARYNIGG